MAKINKLYGTEGFKTTPFLFADLDRMAIVVTRRGNTSQSARSGLKSEELFYNLKDFISKIVSAADGTVIIGDPGNVPFSNLGGDNYDYNPDFTFDGNNLLIGGQVKDVADPTDPQDAVTLDYYTSNLPVPTPPTVPAGGDRQIQFNDAGVFGATDLIDISTGNNIIVRNANPQVVFNKYEFNQNRITDNTPNRLSAIIMNVGNGTVGPLLSGEIKATGYADVSGIVLEGIIEASLDTGTVAAVEIISTSASAVDEKFITRPILGFRHGTSDIYTIIDSNGAWNMSNPLTIGAYTLPNIDGTANYVLKTDGAGVLTWQPDIGNVAGSDTEIQFNNAGVFGGDPNFIWTGSSLDVTGATAVSGELKGGSINVNDNFVLPVADGLPFQVMATDGAGGLSWQDQPNPPISLEEAIDVISSLDLAISDTFYDFFTITKDAGAGGLSNEVIFNGYLYLSGYCTEVTSGRNLQYSSITHVRIQVTNGTNNIEMILGTSDVMYDQGNLNGVFTISLANATPISATLSVKVVVSGGTEGNILGASPYVVRLYGAQSLGGPTPGSLFTFTALGVGGTISLNSSSIPTDVTLPEVGGYIPIDTDVVQDTWTTIVTLNLPQGADLGLGYSLFIDGFGGHSVQSNATPLVAQRFAQSYIVFAQDALATGAGPQVTNLVTGPVQATDPAQKSLDEVQFQMVVSGTNNSTHSLQVKVTGIGAALDINEISFSGTIRVISRGIISTNPVLTFMADSIVSNTSGAVDFPQGLTGDLVGNVTGNVTGQLTTIKGTTPPMAQNDIFNLTSFGNFEGSVWDVVIVIDDGATVGTAYLGYATFLGGAVNELSVLKANITLLRDGSILQFRNDSPTTYTFSYSLIHRIVSV